jgi:uncharacterized protein
MEVGLMAQKMSVWGMIAGILVIIGGLNWGLFGLTGMDIVKLLFGSVPWLAEIVYVLIGLSALYVGYMMSSMM